MHRGSSQKPDATNVMSRPLPITVIVPSKDTRPLLPRHVDAMNEWMHAVAQIVVVDSSTDGSFDFLRAHLSHPDVSYHTRPPGLYAAWNFGVSQAEAEFVYYATIGDRITLDELRRLHETAARHGADVVIAPPRMVQADGTTPSDARWPIHRLADQLRAASIEDCVLPSEWVGVLTSSFPPFSLLGSSASNIYRRHTLTSHPWPEDFGKRGDSAWLCRWFRRVRVAVVSACCADFIAHDDAERMSPAEDFALAGRVLRESLPAWSLPAGDAALSAAAGRAWTEHLEQYLSVYWRWIESQWEAAETVREQVTYIRALQDENQRLRQVEETDRNLLDRLRQQDAENSELRVEVAHLRALSLRLAPFFKLGRVRDVQRRFLKKR